MRKLSLVTCATALCLAFPAVAGAATGAIEGTVTDAISKDPVAHIEVCAYTANSFERGGCGLTDASGNYVIDEAQPGIYVVEFWGVEYLRQYYDGATRRQNAEFVFVNGGATVSGIDAELQPGAKVSGTVRDAPSHEPLADAEVCAYEESTESSSCTSTDTDGTYTLGGLPTGEYIVAFADWESGEEHIVQYYDHKPRWEEANPISLSPGQSRTGVDADLQREARITGTVVDSEGKPVRWAWVCAQTLFGSIARCEEADSAGRYELWRLAPGAYKVVFEPQEEGEGQYKTQYYNEKSGFSLADQVFLSEGSTVPNINARLEKVGKNVVTVTTVPSGSAKRPSSKPRPRKCRKGYRRKLVHGKRRCVRIKPKHHRQAR